MARIKELTNGLGAHSVIEAVGPVVGGVDVTFDVFETPGEPGLSIAAYSVEDGSPAAAAFARLASWAATEFG